MTTSKQTRKEELESRLEALQAELSESTALSWSLYVEAEIEELELQIEELSDD